MVGLTVVGLTGCGASNTGRPDKARPTVYIIDSGRTGWVKVVYNRPDEKELPVEKGFAVAHVGQDLKLFTRSHMNSSWDGAGFYYQDPDGKRVQLSTVDGDSRRIWALEKSTDAKGERETFFVGNQDQMSANLKGTIAIGGGLVQDSAESVKPEQPADSGKVLTELPK